MKTKNVLFLIGTIFILLMSNSLKIYAWLAKDTYMACNIINACISDFLRVVAFCVTIFYITMTIKYIKCSKKETKKKAKNILMWFMITLIQILLVILGASWVRKVGMEEYVYPTGERCQINEIDGYISNAIRIGAFFAIIFYMLKAIAYWIQSKEKNKQKLGMLIKWQIITIIITVLLLVIATNW